MNNIKSEEKNKDGLIKINKNASNALMFCRVITCMLKKLA